MICVSVDNDGSLKVMNFLNLQSYTSEQSSSVCPGVVMVQPTDHFLSEADPILCASFFMFSFSFIVGLYWASFAITQIRRTIR